MTIEAPDISPVEHDRGGDQQPPASAPSDSEATALHGGVETIADPTAGKSADDLAERPVRDFKDIGTDKDPTPVIDFKDFGTDKDPTPVHPLKDHLTDEYSGPVVPFGETAEKAGPGPVRELGSRAMARAAEAIRPKEAVDEPAAGDPYAPEMNAVPHHDDGDAPRADTEHGGELTVGASEHGGDQRQSRDEEADEDGGGEGGDHPEDDALLAALFLPMAARAIEYAETGDDSPDSRDTTGPEDQSADDEDPEEPGDAGGHDGDPPDDGGDGGNGPEDGEPGDEEPEDGGEPGDEDKRPEKGRKDGSDEGNGAETGEREDVEPDDGDKEPKDDEAEDTTATADDDTQVEGGRDDDDPRIPRQRALEERALTGDARASAADGEADTAESADTAVEEQAAIRARDEAHAANVADLEHLAKIASARVTPGGNRNSRIHFELTHNGQDASEYLAELAADLRTGSTDMPRISNWHEELTSPDQLKTGQVVEINSLRDLDEFMARVGGWLNNDIRATRGSGAVLPPPVGNWQDKGYRPSSLVGNVKDLRGRHFNGSQVNIEAMALPKELPGHAPFTRYFTVSSQLKSTGKPPEDSRPMRLVSVSALPIGYTNNTVTARFAEIGRVPAAISAWLIDSRARDVGHDVEFENRQRPIFIAQRH